MSKLRMMRPSLLSLLMLMLLAVPYVAQAQGRDKANGQQPSSLGWSSAIDVSHAEIAIGPNIAMNRNEANINYSLGNTSVKNLYEGNSSDNGHSWNNPDFHGCTNGSTVGTTVPQIAEDIYRDVFMVWQDYCNDPRSLYFNRRDPAGNWTGARRITTFNTNGASLAVSNDGGVYIAYYHVYTSGSDAQLEFISSTNYGDSFSPPILLTGRGQWGNQTSIAVDTANRPHVVYELGPDSNNFHIYARDFVGGAWQPQVTLYGGRSYWPDAAATTLGGVGVVFQINDNGVQAYYKRWYPDAQQWDSISTNVSNNADSNFNPTLTYDTNGLAYIGWARSSGAGNIQIMYTHELSLGAYDTPAVLEGSRSSVPQLASYNNNFNITYQYDGTGDWRIYDRWVASACNSPFTDIGGNIFAPAINYLYCAGKVNGTGPTTFGPSGTSTRAQFAKVVILGFGIPLVTPASQSFTDVPPSYFAYQYIEAGKRVGILGGFDATTCGNYGAAFPCYLPNLPITRGQITKLVVSAAQYTLINPGTPTYIDVQPNNVFYQYIETAHAKGVVNGYPDNTFHPNDNIRRDQMCQIVFAALNSP